MGRAIKMENELDSLKMRVKNIESALSKVIDVVDAMEEKAVTTKPVKKEKKNAKKEKANDKGNGDSNE
tara:strand:+ start:5576 stop:5779 length:204 start_codon:yes stop_codon:yes gene_type:complete